MIQVCEMMTTKVVTLDADATVSQACELMSRGDFRHLPIVNRFGKIIGLVSHRDILRCGVSHLISNHAERQAMLDKKMRVTDIMTSPVRVVHPRDSLRACGALMQKHRFGCLPVVEKGQLVGILTGTDFIRMALHLIEAQESMDDFAPSSMLETEQDEDLAVQVASYSIARFDNMH
ncbi:CBS domain-containing protein [Aurantivibrio plasticivorans]